MARRADDDDIVGDRVAATRETDEIDGGDRDVTKWSRLRPRDQVVKGRLAHVTKWSMERLRPRDQVVKGNDSAHVTKWSR